MKIRIQGNSIRYRLREPEVDAFSKSGSITEVIEFGAGAEDLRFILQQSADDHVIIVRAGNTVSIRVPKQIAMQWTETDLVGFDATIAIGDGKVLKVLIEKDFKCLDASEEDNVGAYPNSAARG